MTTKSIVLALFFATLREAVSIPITTIDSTVPVGAVTPSPPSKNAMASSFSPFTSLLLDRPEDAQVILTMANDSSNSRHLPTVYALVDPASLSLGEQDAFCQQQLLKVFPDGLVHEDGGCSMAFECEFDPLRFPPVIFTGKCLNSYCNNGVEDTLHQCLPALKQLQVLQYVMPETTDGGYQQEASYSNYQNEVTSTGQWTNQIKQVVTDCVCPSS